MRTLVLLAVAAMTVACVRTNATILNPSPVTRAAVPANQVRIYRTATQVPGRYEEIALLHSAGETGWTDERKMMESMRKKAGEVGANGVILDAIIEPGALEKIAGAVLGVGSERKGRAVAIFVFPDSTTKAP